MSRKNIFGLALLRAGMLAVLLAGAGAATIGCGSDSDSGSGEITNDQGAASERITISYPDSSTAWTVDQNPTHVGWSGATGRIRFDLYQDGVYVTEYQPLTANDGHEGLGAHEPWPAGTDFTLKATDENGNWGWSSRFSITAGSLPNEAPIVEDQTFSVSEAAANGTLVGQIAATDPENDDLTYTTSQLGLPFNLATNGRITVSDAAALDYETTRSYTITISVSDGTNTVAGMVTINLQDVNEEPADVAVQIEAIRATIVEGSTEDIFRLYLDQAPLSGLAITYTLSGSADNGSDYDLLSGTVTIATGQTEAYVNIAAVNDGIAEDPETVTLTLVVADGYRLGNADFASCTIEEAVGASIRISHPDSSTVWAADENPTRVAWSGATGRVSFDLYQAGTRITEYLPLTTNDGNESVGSHEPWPTGTNFRIKATDENGNSGWSFAFTITAVETGGDKTIADLGMTLKEISPGTFMMSSPTSEELRDNDREGPQQHQVTITQAFWMATTETTQAQYQQIIEAYYPDTMESNPSEFTGDPSRPVETVSRPDVAAFCAALTLREAANIPQGYEYRLPTEAEWEYCCRAGTTTAYSFGDDELGKYAWYSVNSGGTTHPVGDKVPNGWGLYDMHGNVWEWCHDFYGQYTAEEQVDPTGYGDGPQYVFRGGPFSYGPKFCRSATRMSGYPGTAHNNIGFRVVLAPELP